LWGGAPGQNQQIKTLAWKYGAYPRTEQLGEKGYPCWYAILDDMYDKCGLIFYLRGNIYAGAHDEILYYTPLRGPFSTAEFCVWVIL